MTFTRLFKVKAKKASSPFAIEGKPTLKVEFVPLEWANRTPQFVYRSGNKHQSLCAEICYMEEESAPCASRRDEDNSSVASESTTTTAVSARGLIPTSDSWLYNEYPSVYYKEGANKERSDDEESSEEESENEMEGSPMSSTETLIDVYPRAPATAAKIEAIAREVEEKPKYALSVLESCLIPLAVAQARADVKYRPEGFELKEAKEAAKEAKAKFAKAKRGEEKTWWC